MNYNPKVVSFERSPAFVHHRAMVNRRENKPVDALELMRHVVEQSPDNREYRLDLAELYCEMGCHEQSNRLLLDMLAQKDAPAECYYGLALNQLGMNDLEGAKQSLRLYRTADPEGALNRDANRLAAELDIFDALNRPNNRRVYRAMKISDRACDAMRDGDLDGAKRLFERSLKLSSEQYEMRAMYAMTLLMRGDEEAAASEAARAAEGFPPSARALCVAAQVFHALGKPEKAAELVKRVMEEHPTGVELRMLIYTLGELEMHELVADCARIALQETPYDRHMLHIRAVALYYSGKPEEQLRHFWLRILRLDPDDTVAGFYQDAAMQSLLSENPPEYAYQVPDNEYERRFLWLSEKMEGGLTAVRKTWESDGEFRRLIRWAASSDDEKLRRVAVTVIAAMDDEEARSSVRSLMFNREIQTELKLHAASLLRLRGVDMRSVLPAEPDVSASIPDAESLLEELLVGERQLLRYADEVLREDYGISALASLTLMWAVYRRNRGTRFDPLVNSEAVSAALVYVYLLQHGRRVELDEIAKRFYCPVRRMVFYASRIADILDHYEGETKDEDL